jgi:hypothetical protein
MVFLSYVFIMQLWDDWDDSPRFLKLRCQRGWIIADFADVKLKDVDDGKWLQAGL